MVIWTPRARADLKAIYDYIADDSPLNAKKIIHGGSDGGEDRILVFVMAQKHISLCAMSN